MALVACPDCGEQVSTSAAACPHCGRPMGPSGPAPVVVKKNPTLLATKIVGSLLIAGGMLGACGSCTSSSGATYAVPCLGAFALGLVLFLVGRVGD